MTLYKSKGLLYAYIQKGVGNKGRWLGEVYKGNAKAILELY